MAELKQSNYQASRCMPGSVGQSASCNAKKGNDRIWLTKSGNEGDYTGKVPFFDFHLSSICTTL
jgi:hypothetical protein